MVKNPNGSKPLKPGRRRRSEVLKFPNRIRLGRHVHSRVPKRGNELFKRGHDCALPEGLHHPLAIAHVTELRIEIEVMPLKKRAPE
jgi:hypothetical protein